MIPWKYLCKGRIDKHEDGAEDRAIDSREKEEEGRARARARVVAALEIVDERVQVEGTDAEVDAVIWSGGEWKASDSHGLQMGFVRRAWPVIAPWCNGDGDLEAQWVGTRKYIWEQCFKSTGYRARIEMETDDEETKEKVASP
ncbi:hypothetical protein B0H13DRAFT_1904696 [Mycena leptocephala]|nr:hypothetical protein B0H13DRAFT_1904696 [Mycena leptocephala]